MQFVLNITSNEAIMTREQVTEFPTEEVLGCILAPQHMPIEPVAAQREIIRPDMAVEHGLLTGGSSGMATAAAAQTPKKRLISPSASKAATPMW